MAWGTGCLMQQVAKGSVIPSVPGTALVSPQTEKEEGSGQAGTEGGEACTGCRGARGICHVHFPSAALNSLTLSHSMVNPEHRFSPDRHPRGEGCDLRGPGRQQDRLYPSPGHHHPSAFPSPKALAREGSPHKIHSVSTTQLQILSFEGWGKPCIPEIPALLQL